MGCDIHLFAEVKRKGKWESLEVWEDKEEENADTYRTITDESAFYTVGCNYYLFAALGCVKNVFRNKLPKPISKSKGVPEDCSEEVKNQFISWAWNYHHASWNTLTELKKYEWLPWEGKCDTFIQEVIPKLEAVGVPPSKVRIVYFFDN